MDIKRLRMLAAGLPCGGRSLYLARNAAPRARQDSDNPWEADIEAYVQTYKDVSFGFTYVKHLAKNGLPFPVLDRYDEEAKLLRDAYNMMRGDSVSEDLLAVFAWTRPEMRTQRAVIDSMLLSDGADLQENCRRLGLLPRRIQMYEKLFFNVLDRAADSLYLNDIVYPGTRLVEMYDGYVKEAPFRDMLLRSGYNNGTDDMLWLAGVRKNKAVDTASRGSLPSKFETLIMANGYIMARNGFGMQSGQNAPALSAAKNFISAAKQAGGEGAGVQLPELASLAEVVKGEMMARLTQQAEVRTALRRSMLNAESTVAKAG